MLGLSTSIRQSHNTAASNWIGHRISGECPCHPTIGTKHRHRLGRPSLQPTARTGIWAFLFPAYCPDHQSKHNGDSYDDPCHHGIFSPPISLAQAKFSHYPNPDEFQFATFTNIALIDSRSMSVMAILRFLSHWADQPRNRHANKARLIVLGADQVVGIVGVHVVGEQHAIRVGELYVRAGIVSE